MWRRTESRQTTRWHLGCSPVLVLGTLLAASASARPAGVAAHERIVVQASTEAAEHDEPVLAQRVSRAKALRLDTVALTTGAGVAGAALGALLGGALGYGLGTAAGLPHDSSGWVDTSTLIFMGSATLGVVSAPFGVSAAAIAYERDPGAVAGAVAAHTLGAGALGAVVGLTMHSLYEGSTGGSLARDGATRGAEILGFGLAGAVVGAVVVQNGVAALVRGYTDDEE